MSKTGFVGAVGGFIPSKITKTKYSVPWIDVVVGRLVERRHTCRLCLRVRGSGNPDVKVRCARLRAHVQRVLRDAYWKYLSNIFTFENDGSDPDPAKTEKIKTMSWSFIKSTHSEKMKFLRFEEKANICNRQFQAAFTREADSDLSSKEASPFSSMGEITVYPKRSPRCWMD